MTSQMKMLRDAGYLTKIRDFPLKSGTPVNPDPLARNSKYTYLQSCSVKFSLASTVHFRMIMQIRFKNMSLALQCLHPQGVYVLI